MKIYNLKTRLALVVACFVMSVSAWAQVPMTESLFSAPYSAISVGGGATLSTAAGDDGVQGSVPIGFTFNYLGTAYSSVAISTNGWISFNSTTTSGSFTNTDMYSTAGPNNALFPWFDDLTMSVNSVAGAPSILYQTQGIPGSQTFTVQWTNFCAYRTAGGTAINFQVVLREGTDVIEFYYGTKTDGTFLTGQSASIGIENATGGNNNYIDATTGSGKVGHYYLTEAQWPAYNFRFTPGVPSALAGGVYNVGVGQVYRNLTEASIDLNQRGVSGSVLLQLVDAVYDTSAAGGNNMFPILFGPISGTGVASPVQITKPGPLTAQIRWGGCSTGSTNGAMVNQANTAINGSNVEPIFALVGADYFLVSKINVRGDISYQNADHAIGVYNSSATDGSTNNQFMNISVTMRRGNTGSRAIIQNVVTTPSSALGANSDNTYKNLTIRNVYAGVQLAGNASFPDLNTEVGTTACATFNSIGNPSLANDIGNGTTATYGINAINQSGVKIYNNIIRNVTNTGGQADGINIVTFQGTSSVYNNNIQSIRNGGTASTTTVAGIRASHTTTGTHTLRIYNNSISDITSGYTGAASATRTIKGLFVAGTGGGTTQVYEIYNNSVSINGSLSPTISSVCFEISTATGPVYNLGNNIFANYTIAQGATARHYAMFTTSATSFGPAGTTSNNNDLYIANDQGVSGFVGRGNTADYATLANWQTGIATPAGIDATSISVDPVFVNMTTDLHASALTLNGAGIAPPAYITNDLDCATRTPDNDIGAYILNTCTGTPTAGTINGISTLCSGGNATLNLTGASADAGITYQWASSTVSGGPYSNLGTGTTQATGALSATTYYIVTVTCAFGSSASTSEFTVNVNPLPTVSVTPTSANYCNPGTAVALAASGTAISYAWLPAAGLSATTGANVNATPGSTTTYTVTGTDGNGCTNAATAAITVSPAVIINIVTASPSAVCSGGTSNLLASAALTPASASSFVYTASTGNSLETITSPTVVTTVTGGSLDDGYITVTPSFSFNFLGTNITSYSVGTNGYIVLNDFSSAIPANINTITGMNIIHAFGRDGNLNVANGGDLTHGPAAGGKYVFQSTKYSGGAGGGTSATIFCTYQIVFWGSTSASPGRIDIIYGTSAGTPATAGTIGIRDLAGTFINGVNGSTSLTTTAASWPVSGQMYSFTLPAPTSYTWVADPTLSATNIANPVASGMATTTTYTVTASQGSCAATGTVTVTVGSPLSSTASVTPSATVCAGTNVTLNSTATGGGAPYTYAWAGPNAFASTNQNPVITGATVAATGTYTVTVTDNCGTNSVSTVSLTVNPLPTVAVTPNSASYCNPGTAVALNASGASTYTWLPASGLSATTGANVNASPAATTTYTVTGTDGNGCVNTATTVISSSPSVTISSATASPNVLCAGGNSNLASAASFVTSAYCTAGATSTSFEKISNVTIGSINNNSSATAGYENFTAINTNITAGVSTPISIGVSSAYANDDRIHVWVDMNQDGLFTEPAERVLDLAISTFCPACSGTNTTVTGNITIPVTAFNGATRMRIRLQDQSSGPNSTSCGTSTYGQVEDYTLNITNAIDNTISYAWSPSTYLSSTSIANPVASAIASSVTYTLTASSSLGCSAQSNVAITANPLPTVTATSDDADNAVCAGTAVVLTGGGASTYAWTGSVTDGVAFTPASTNTYTVTGTDGNSCQNTATITVTVNSLPTVTATSDDADNAVCAGTAVVLTGGGASTYTWTGSVTDGVAFTPASTNTYTVTGTDGNGCENTANITVTVNSLPTVTATSDAAGNTVCDGSDVTLSGSGADSYVWTGGVTDATAFTPLATDTYTVTGTDLNGCTGTDAITITVNSIPTVTAMSDDADNAICEGLMVTLNGDGADTYSWTGGVTDGASFAPTTTDTYTVTGTLNGCSNTATITITVNALPTVDLAPFATSVCDNGGVVSLTDGTPTGGLFSGLGVTGSTFDPSVTGTGIFPITYSITDANGCVGSDVEDITVDLCTGIASNSNNTQSIVVYPNPTTGMFTLNINNANSNQVVITIVDMQGKVVYNESDKNVSSQYNKQVDLTDLAKGIYYVKLNIGSEVKIEKLIVQ